MRIFILINKDILAATSPVIMVSQLPTTVKGEQLLAQYTAAISNRQWQFRYSRMPMFFVCSEHLGMVRF